MKTLKLSTGEIVFVDDEDFEKLNKFRWYRWSRKGCSYAIGRMGGRRMLKMHNVVTPPPLGREVDHKDRNGLNNQKSNLRFANRSQNNANNTSWSKWGFKGVSFHRNCPNRPFFVRCALKGKVYYDSSFSTPIEAAKAYNRLALKLYGKFANLNKV